MFVEGQRIDRGLTQTIEQPFSFALNPHRREAPSQNATIRFTHAVGHSINDRDVRRHESQSCLRYRIACRTGIDFRRRSQLMDQLGRLYHFP